MKTAEILRRAAKRRKSLERLLAINLERGDAEMKQLATELTQDYAAQMEENEACKADRARLSA